MVDAVDQIVTLLQKINSALNITALTPDEVSDGNISVANIKKNILKFKKFTDAMEIAQLQKIDFNKTTLNQLTLFLENIIRDLENLYNLIVIVAQRRVAYIKQINE